MIGLLVKKNEMSELVLPDGSVAPVTWLKAAPNFITQIKTVSQDGYSAIQIGAGKRRYPSMAMKQHLKELDARIIRELKTETAHQRGEKIDVSLFSVGDVISATGMSKGKGFAGTIKRHSFHRGPMSHGHDHHRAPGSIGPMGIARVLPGKRMAGHMGAEQVTTRGLKVIAIDPKLDRLAVKGSVPGARQSWLLIKKDE